jgi:hypothetical protein
LKGEITTSAAPEWPSIEKKLEKLEVPLEILDITVYLRGLINENRDSRDMRIFFSWIDTLPHFNRAQLYKDYLMITGLRPGQGRPDVFGVLDGINW